MFNNENLAGKPRSSPSLCCLQGIRFPYAESLLYCKLRPHDTMDECLREIGDLQEMIANILQRNEPDSFKTITADELLAQTFKKPATISDLRIEIKVAEQVDTQVRSKLPVIPRFHLHVIFACAS